jgi:ABC-type transport system involved in cytochrome c biogenesis permease component
MRGARIKLFAGSMKAGEVAQHHLNKRRGKLAVGGKLLLHSPLLITILVYGSPLCGLLLRISNANGALIHSMCRAINSQSSSRSGPTSDRD